MTDHICCRCIHEPTDCCYTGHADMLQALADEWLEKEQPRSAVYVPGEVSEAEAEQIKAAIQQVPPTPPLSVSEG